MQRLSFLNFAARKALALIVMTLPFASSAHASEYISTYVGAFDVFNEEGPSATVYGLEYRYKNIYHGLRPLIGVEGNSDGATYGYTGIIWDVALTDHIIFSPNTAIGAYRQGGSKDLGYGLEFKSGAELAYQFDAGYRVGAAINHISNASLGSTNPGVEQVVAVFSYPLNFAE